MDEAPVQQTVPRDLYELYIVTRSETSMGLNFFQLYHKYIFLVDIGKEMLPTEYKELQKLRESAEDLLADGKTYPGTRQMEYVPSRGTYRISPGTAETGLIEVRKEDLAIALEEAKNQQATTLFPKLKALDNQIFNALVEYGIIKIKEPSLEELLTQEVMAGIQEYTLKSQKLIDEQEEKEKK